MQSSKSVPVRHRIKFPDDRNLTYDQHFDVHLDVGVNDQTDHCFGLGEIILLLLTTRPSTVTRRVEDPRYITW